jgi:hypothetical protein
LKRREYQMTEATEETPAANPNVLAITIPNTATTEGGDDQSVSIDLGGIPAEARLELLRNQVRDVVRNRVNVAVQRSKKAREPFSAWAAYNAAIAADPLQTALAKPEGEAPTGDMPAAVDPIAKANEAIASLLKGELGARRGEGNAAGRTPKDPLVTAVTGVVARAVYEANKGTTVADGKGGTRKFTYPDAVKLVGGDGVAYLNAQIDAKVSAAPEAEQAALRTQLEKRRDDQYVNPARIMLGQTATGKKGSELPSIL